MLITPQPKREKQSYRIYSGNFRRNPRNRPRRRTGTEGVQIQGQERGGREGGREVVTLDQGSGCGRRGGGGLTPVPLSHTTTFPLSIPPRRRRRRSSPRARLGSWKGEGEEQKAREQGRDGDGVGRVVICLTDTWSPLPSGPRVSDHVSPILSKRILIEGAKCLLLILSSQNYHPIKVVCYTFIYMARQHSKVSNFFIFHFFASC